MNVSARALFVLGALAAAASTAGANVRLHIEGEAEGAIIDTDPESIPLSRNQGDPELEGGLSLWSALQATPELSLFVLGEIEGSHGHESETDFEIEQALVRWSRTWPLSFALEGGKMTMPIGSFGTRYLASTNPLVGSPVGYASSYPWGFKAQGAAGMFDFALIAMDSPMAKTYLPEAEPSLRPAARLGLTPMVGLRIGAYHTAGSYLDEVEAADLPAGTSWRDYDQIVTGVEAHLSRGYLDLRGEAMRTAYDVPTMDRQSGVSSWIEAQYTWTPRVYTAVRLGQDRYPFIDHAGAFWFASDVELLAVEAGAGYRFGPHTLIKASAAFTTWDTPAGSTFPMPDGHALAVQLSHRFDARSWFEEPR
jgi:hypothetical protein